MKKIVASILTLTLVFTAAIAVSAAPTVSGQASHIIDFSGSNDVTEFKLNLDGQVDKNINYNLQLKQAYGTQVEMSTGDTVIAADNNNVFLNNASVVVKSDLATVQMGKFGYSTSVMNDDLNFYQATSAEMKAPFAVKVSKELTPNVNVALGFLPRAEGTFEASAYQFEADYNMDMVSFGVNYQNQKEGNVGLTGQIVVKPTENLKLYTEIGRDAYTEEEQTLVGAAVNTEKFNVVGEYDMNENHDAENQWVGKAAYNFTKNLSAEIRKNANTDIRMTYKF